MLSARRHRRRSPEHTAYDIAGRFEALIDTAMVLVVGLDRRGRITFVNKHCERVTGYSHEEVLGKIIFRLLIPEDERAAAQQVHRDLIAGESVPCSVNDWVTRDGERLTIEWRNSVIIDAEGSVQEVFSIGIDVTGYKRVERQLQRALAYAEGIVETVREPLVILDSELRVLSANRSFYEVFQVSREETEGRYIYELGNRQWDIPELRILLEKILPLNTEFHDFLVEHDFPVIGHKTMLLNARRIYIEGNRTQMILLAIEDITRRRRAEEELLEAKNRAEFLVDLMTHDLNNINQGIMLALELILCEKGLPDRCKERVQLALAQVRRSTQLIASVKRFQCMETEPRRIRARDLYPAVVAAAEAVKQVFPQKQLDLKMGLREGEYLVRADEFLVELFFNLLHNAMKFDRKSKVVVDIRVLSAQKEGFLRVEVRDRGPGIPDVEKERILSRLAGGEEIVYGSGIGLTLAQRIVNRYGGKIWVEDRVKGDHTKGASFVILLPWGDR